MAKYVIEDTTLTNIASAIREKTGKSELLLPSQMPSEIQSISGGGDTDYQLNADMKWAKQVCIDDVQEGYTYKVLEMISDGYVYHDIVVPSGGAVKTSDGGYYTSSTKHTWDDTNARIPEYYQNMKLRWIITYYPSETTASFSLYDDVIYVVIDGLKHSNTDFSSHYSLEYFEYINGGSYTGTSFNFMFQKCYSLQSIPELNTSQETSFNYMFGNCYSLQTIPELNTSSGTSFNYMFNNCYSLQTIPELNTSSGTSFSSMFGNCYSLQTIPELNTSSGASFSDMFINCSSLQTITRLNLNSANFIGSFFSGNSKLEFINLLNITKSLSLSSSTKYSRETLVNGVLNNLVDLTGQTSQTLTLGSTNLNKLTEEDKLIAVNKNWILA